MEKNLSKDISLYEKIRQLDKFNPNHCPIMEFQIVDDKTFFLQYHRTRDRELSTFILNRALEEGEFEATYVRGTTGPKEIILNAAMYYPAGYNLLDHEDASFDFHYNDIFSDIMSRRRIVDITKGSLRDIACRASDGAHITKSKLFNAQLSIGIPSEKIPEKLRKSVYQETKRTGVAARIPISIISDGTKAYVKLLEK